MSAATTHDPEADATYLRLAPERIENASTLEVATGIVLDLDATALLAGIEALNARNRDADGGASLATRSAG